MATTLIIGAGPLGRATAAHLIADDREVVVATRSGRALPGSESLALDITHPEAPEVIARLASDRAGIAAIVAAFNWPYPRWAERWPPATEHLIAASERTGAPLVLVGNLYGYAAPGVGADGTPHALREDDPVEPPSKAGRIRAEVWRRILAAQTSGRIRATEIRGSDYIGPATGPYSHGGDRLMIPVLEGRVARPIGSADQPHSWTSTDDFGRMLARATHDERMLGRAWHVPNAPACTIRELAESALARDGRPGERARLQVVPAWAIAAMSPFAPFLRELHGLLYQFTRPFVVDDTAARTELGETNMSLETTLDAAIAAARHRDV